MRDPERDDLTVAIAETHPTLPWGLCCAIAETVIREGWAPERTAASRDAAVREALERAAKVVEHFSEGPDSDDIADAIRALIPGGPA